MENQLRPRLAEFQERLGAAFSVKTPTGDGVGTWVLQEVKRLPSPSVESLADLESFSILFSHQGADVQPQGIYTLDDGEGYRCELFAVPCSPSEMAVTIN